MSEDLQMTPIALGYESELFNNKFAHFPKNSQVSWNQSKTEEGASNNFLDN